MNYKFKHPHLCINGWLRAVGCRTRQMVKGCKGIQK